MAMSLNADDLRKLADHLDELGKMPFEVNEIKSGDHKVKLRKSNVTSHGPEGETVAEYRVIGVTDGEWSHGIMRGNS